MVNDRGSLDATFAALTDPTRRAILARLARTPGAPVGELARPFAISLSAVSRHLRVLESAGLLLRRKDGRLHHCRLVARPMKGAADWIGRYRSLWDSRLDKLESFLSETTEEEKPWTRPHPARKHR